MDTTPPHAPAKEGYIEPETLEQHDIDRIDGIGSSPSKSTGGLSNSAMQQSTEDLDQPVRARVFALVDDGSWEDLATGLFVIQDFEKHQMIRILDQEDPNSVLFEIDLNVDEAICLQNETVLGWKPENSRELAISFEYQNSLNAAWHHICAFQSRPPEFIYFGGHVKISLPETVDPNSIPIIEMHLSQYMIFYGLRIPLADLILEQRHIPQLLDQFKVACDLDDHDLIDKIFNIFRTLVLLSNRSIYETLFDRENAGAVAAVFEYDKDLPTKPDYRNAINAQSQFLSIPDFPKWSELIRLIHQTFRTQYFKDVILPRYLDDEVYSSLTTLVRSYFSQILDTLDSDPQYYSKLSSLFTTENREMRLQVIKFFKEFIALSKTNNARQMVFFKSQALFELLGFIHRILSDFSPENKSAGLAAEVLLSIIQIDPTKIQSWMKEEQSKLPIEQQLMKSLIDRFHLDPDFGIRWHLVSILRTILDPPNPTGPNAASVPQFELFNEYFYQHHAHRLLIPFCDIEKAIQARKLTDVECDHYFHMCELVSSFVLLHAYKIKYLLVRDQMLHGVCFLMRCHQSFVQLASLRVFRTLISVKDTFYHRTMLSSHIFEQVVEVYRACRGRNNLLRAAILDFFTAIHADRCQVLIDYLVPKYRELLEGFASDHEVFSRIISLYDSGYKVGEESQISTDGAGQDKSKGVADTSVSTGNWGDIDFSEEDYFSGAETANDQEMQEAPIVGEESKQIEDELPPIPPLRAKAGQEEEFGGVLGGDGPAKPAPPSPAATKTGPMKLGLKIGTTLSNLWKSASTSGANSNSTAVANGAGSESPASPNKKSKF